ncbi:hypothetical protein [Clostridium sp. BJN0001]|uniref:hypothetical protein n=1 Tax=Clostridium sp. BJN0001 TaxID=2930219 RepID=UPI001FD18DE6|nr:hypothetical protein [Clostridium sp. BJN0001]
MSSNLALKKSLDQSITSGKKTHFKHLKKVNRKINIRIYITLLLSSIIISSLYISYNIYNNFECRDLSYSIEYNFTHGIYSEDKFSFIEKISLVQSSENRAIVKITGLDKKPPHKRKIVISSFIKDDHNIWTLEKIYTSTNYFNK